MIRFYLLFVSLINFPLFLSAQHGQLLGEYPEQISVFEGVYSTGEVLSSDSLTGLLDEVFDSIAMSSPVYGFSAAMKFEDGSIWRRSSGLAQSLPQEKDLQTNDLLGMGSITKSFIATTILLLVEEGLLSLEDSIGKYLEPYPNISADITVRQILNHRSGLNDYLNENEASLEALFLYPDSIWEVDTILHHFVLAPNFQPGAGWSYSNTNYLLSGRVIEEVTGRNWHAVVREKILDPLGLHHTYAFPYEAIPDTMNMAHVYADLTGLGIQDVQGTGFPLDGLFSMASAAGCLVSTPTDIAEFTEALYSGRLVSTSSLEEMQTDYVMNPFFGGVYGLGVSQFGLPQDVENWGHNGSIIYQSFALYFPEKGVTIAVQQNDERGTGDDEPVNDIYVMLLALLDACINFDLISNTKSLESSPEMVLFPNPAVDHLQINFADSGENKKLPVRIVDMQGKVIVELPGNIPASRINIQHLDSGLYVLKLGPHSTVFQVQR